MFGFFWHGIRTAILKRRVNGPISANCLNYFEHGAICGTETAKLTGCFVPQAHSGYIWSFYRYNKNWYMKKVKSDQARKPKNMTFCLLQNTRNLQHICTRSPILVVTLHAALQNGSTVPAGRGDCQQKSLTITGNNYVEYLHDYKFNSMTTARSLKGFKDTFANTQWVFRDKRYANIWAASQKKQQNDCAPHEDSDQPGHSPSLIRVFAVRSVGN